ncbi:MAG TPA: GNAT family N-acetyltransferase [Anaerolineae bacterium]|nr:GNAT family N-acetyltransferase [Anaerolineae bacterium]
MRITAEAGVFKPIEVSCVEELWNEYQSELEASGYVFLVHREDDGSVTGYSCFGTHPLTEGTYDLYWIAVDPATRGRGIGHALLSRTEREVYARGGRLLLVETSSTPTYAAARALYESGGYHFEACVHDFYAPGDDLLIYAKVLDPRPDYQPQTANALVPARA